VGGKIPVKLMLIGETGNGKSSLGNYILGKEVFRVSSKPRSETKITEGKNGDDENSNIVVIDTPGFQDTEGEDKKHIEQMVNYLKSNVGVQAVLIVFNYHQPKLASHIKTMMKILYNIFSFPNFWSHVAIVFTRFYHYIPLEEQEKKQTVINKFIPEVLNLVKETTGDQSIKSFPTFFVDADLNNSEDQYSRYQTEELILWAHRLNTIDVDKIKFADPNIKDVIVEEEVRESKVVQLNVEHITYEFFRRNKEIHYDGTVSYTNWKKYKEEKRDNVL